MQKIMPLAQFTINLEWCASEAHTRGESLLRGHGANREDCHFPCISLYLSIVKLQIGQSKKEQNKIFFILMMIGLV